MKEVDGIGFAQRPFWIMDMRDKPLGWLRFWTLFDGVTCTISDPMQMVRHGQSKAFVQDVRSAGDEWCFLLNGLDGTLELV